MNANDIEALRLRVRQLERENAGLRVDSYNKTRQALAREAAALQLAASAGITNADIDEQIAHDRRLWGLAEQREEQLTKTRNALINFWSHLRQVRVEHPDATVTVALLVDSLSKVLDGTKPTLNVAKSRPVQGDLFEEAS